MGKSTYQLVIAPPFYLRWWFILLAILTLSGVLYLVYFMLVRRALAREVRRRELQEHLALERDRIAEEVHDDLGGQLASILFISQSLLLNPGKSKEPSKEVRRISELSKKAILNVRDIIFTLDTSRATLGNLFDQLEFVGQETFSDLPINFTTTARLGNEALLLSIKEKRNLTLLVKESFNNVIKHAQASNVSLSIRNDCDFAYVLMVADDGVGLAESKRNTTPGRISFGLQNMERKCREIRATLSVTSNAVGGTTITVTRADTKEKP